MSEKLQHELDKNRFWIVKKGFIIILITMILIIASLLYLKIDNVSILEMIFKYYFK